MTELSEERIAEIREHGMRLSDFTIGLEFWMSGFRWRCTDVGTRLVIALQLNHDHEPDWYSGPPYAVPECPIDVLNLRACSLSRHEGNSQYFTDDEVEGFRFSGNTETETVFSDIPKISQLPAGWRRVRDYGGIHNYLRYRHEERRKRRAAKVAAEQKGAPPHC